MGVMNRRMITIDKTIAKTRLRMSRALKAVGNYELHVYRTPVDFSCVPSVVYKAFEVEKNSLVFFWDSVIYDLTPGQYAGIIYDGCVVCDTININIPDCGMVLDSHNTEFTHDACVSMQPGDDCGDKEEDILPADCQTGGLINEGATIADVEAACNCNTDNTP